MILDSFLNKIVKFLLLFLIFQFLLIVNISPVYLLYATSYVREECLTNEGYYCIYTKDMTGKYVV
jgi:hypothetical protein